MKRSELTELHHIAAISNVPPILRFGILSHVLAERVQHESLAMPEIQARRAKVVIPGGRPLHRYVNLYMNARNKMMFKVKSQRGHLDICVLRVSTEVLDLPKVVVSDRNASSKYVRFGPSPGGIAAIDRNTVFAEWWIHPDDQIATWKHASAMCAEVLVPDRVEPKFVFGAHVSCE